MGEGYRGTQETDDAEDAGDERVAAAISTVHRELERGVRTKKIAIVRTTQPAICIARDAPARSFKARCVKAVAATIARMAPLT